MSAFPTIDDAADRVLEHVEAGTTDLAVDVMRVEAESYSDPQLWRWECDSLFRALPLPLAHSAEVPATGSYKTMDVLGESLLIARGQDGIVRTFLNVCRHRGARLCAEERGSRRAFVCPYHGWTYNNEGHLVAVRFDPTFGRVDERDRGLRSLLTVERHGLIWVTRRSDVRMRLDDWLGAYGDELAKLQLENWHVHDQRIIPGPNWKIAYDGYLDSYHGATLHSQSLRDGWPNMSVVDVCGPHQRIIFPLRSAVEMIGTTQGKRNPQKHCVPSHTVFPCLSIAGGWQDMLTSCLILPGSTPDASVTYQTTMTRRKPTARREVAQARAFSGRMFRVARDEDYLTGYNLQAGIASGANHDYLIGRNEPSVQHFHRSLETFVSPEACRLADIPDLQSKVAGDGA